MPSKTPKPPSDPAADALVASINLEEARLKRMIDSWRKKSPKDESDEEKRAERERREREEEEEEFKFVPETLGVGATLPTENQDEGVLRGVQRGGGADEGLSRLLLGKGRGKGKRGMAGRENGASRGSGDHAERLKRLMAGGKVERDWTARGRGTVAAAADKPKHGTLKRAPPSDDDEEVGRSALGGTSRKRARIEDEGQLEVDGMDVKDGKVDAPTNEVLPRSKSSKRAKRYLDEVLEERARKKRKKKNKAAASSAD